MCWLDLTCFLSKNHLSQFTTQPSWHTLTGLVLGLRGFRGSLRGQQMLIARFMRVVTAMLMFLCAVLRCAVLHL